MFYGKKIKALEGRLDALEVMVQEQARLISKYCQEVDALYEHYKKMLTLQDETPAPVTPAPEPKPRRRPKRRNGKENPKATE